MPTLFTGQYCRAAIAFVALLLAGLSSGVPDARAQSLRVSGGYHWTVLASTKDLDNAIGIARIYGRDARVVLSTNGWYATVLVPRKGSLADMAKGISWPGFPTDAFLSNGRGFATVVWKPKSGLIDKADLDDERSAEVSGGGLDVTVRRIRNGDGWTAEIDGRIGDRDVFSLSQPFPDASHFRTSVKLVRLQPADPYPDVVFDSYTGGAHCCTVETAVIQDGSGFWRLADLGRYDGGGVWFENADDGGAMILHGDNAFLYQFSSYAESHQPLVIEKLVGGRLTNVSADPSSRRRMMQDLKGLEFEAKLDPNLWHSNAFLAAWVAEKIRVGEGAEAWTSMLRLYSPNSAFGVLKCPGGKPPETCRPDQQITLPFPAGLMAVLQQRGYFAPPQEGSNAPSVQAKVSTGPAKPATPSPDAVAPSDKRDEAETAYTGTAFFVDKDTLITNAHVVNGCSQVATALHGLKDEGTVVARDKANDLALIRTHVSSQSVAHIRGGARLGEDVSVFGFPLAGFLASSGNFTRGNITAAAGLQDDTRYFQISAPVQPGNSGGPLLDRYGNVVGIVVAKLNALAVASVTDDLAQNVNFAIKASIAESFLTANGVKSTTGEADKMLAPEDIAAKAESFAVEVECRPGEK